MTAMPETPPHPFPTLCLRLFGILTAGWLLGTGYWAYNSTQQEWTRIQHVVYPSPREDCLRYNALFGFRGFDQGPDWSVINKVNKLCDDLSDQRTTGAGTSLSAVLVPRLPILLSVTLLPPIGLFAIGVTILHLQRRRPLPPAAPTRSWW